MYDPLSMTFALVTLASLAQAVAGWLAIGKFTRQHHAGPQARPAVTVLKPLYGDEPLLEQALASLCAQDYPVFQVVFGVQNASDPALAVLHRLRARFPGLDMAMVVDPARHGSNHKVSNLINMLPFARYDVLVVADSDVHSPPGYLDSLVNALAGPGVGVVTTLYAGLAATPSLTARLGVSHINHSFLPGALLARRLGRQDCLGATMALSRSTLGRIGGFQSLADHLADDAVLGQRVRAQGLSVALADTIPATTVAETHLPDLFQHELRWARTVKSLAPAGFVASSLQYPLFWAALTVAASGCAAWAWLVFALTWAVRGAVAHGIDRRLHVAPSVTIWCLPHRDLLSVMVMLASYGSDRVAWRGQVHHVTRPIF